MQRRQLLRWTAAGVLVGMLAGIAAFVLLPSPPLADRVDRAHFDRLRPRMRRADVEALVGPSGDYTSGPTSYYVDSAPHFPSTPGCSIATWKTDSASAGVIFNTAGKVEDSWLY
jgi:hypothetical protein